MVESHPIFSGNPAGLGTPERFFMSADDGSRLILIENSTVRWCYASDRDYNFMPLQLSLDGIKHAVVSKSGEFVCLYNDIEFRVIEIPWGYKNASSMARAFQKCSYKIGDDESGFKQMVFHPLAHQQDTLVILKDDDSVTIANWRDFAGAKHVVLNVFNGSYSLDSYVSDIESIAFSIDGVALYALSTSEGADIYAFYPCLPPVIDVPETLLDELMYKSLIQYQELTADTESDVKKNTIKQLQFISKLREPQADAKSLEIPSDLRQVQAQGPFTVAPFPDEIYSCTGRQISSMPIDGKNQLLLMVLDDGSVAILLQDLEPTMNWAFTGYNFNDSLTLVELVKLKTQNVKELVVEKKLIGKFSVLTDEGYFTVDTTKWSSVLAKCLEESDSRPLGEIAFKSDTTFTKCSNPPRSLALWATDGQDEVVAVTTTGVKSESLPLRNAEPRQPTKDITKPDDKRPYESPYSQSIEEIAQLSRRFQRELAKPPSKIIDPRDRQVPLKNDSSETQLDLLTEYSKAVLQKIGMGQSLGATLHNRLLEQQSDLTLQLKTTAELIQKREDMQETLEWQKTRFEQLDSRHAGLQSRFDKLRASLGKIGDSHKFQALAINKKELEWFKEIRNQVLLFNQNVRSQQKLQEQLEFLTRELDRISTTPSPSDADSRSREEWQELRSMLEEDTKILQKCSHQLNVASRQVPANP